MIIWHVTCLSTIFKYMETMRDDIECLCAISVLYGHNSTPPLVVYEPGTSGTKVMFPQQVYICPLSEISITSLLFVYSRRHLICRSALAAKRLTSNHKLSGSNPSEVQLVIVRHFIAQSRRYPLSSSA